MKKSIKIEEVLQIYKEQWDKGNILSPRELEQVLQSRGGQAIKPPTKFNSSSPQDIELSLCKFCNCMTKTMQVAGLSASENKHYRYECGKCGAKKELEIIGGKK